MKIIVIDDEEILVRTFSKLLEKQGHDVFGFKKGADAIAFSEEETMDLIICDIKMPGQNGVEIIKSIFEHLDKQNKKRTPLIFISGYADKELEARAWDLEPLAFLRKPFDAHELIKIIPKI